jgi:hypothetical protein
MPKKPSKKKNKVPYKDEVADVEIIDDVVERVVVGQPIIQVS